jgi:hypothetical protein
MKFSKYFSIMLLAFTFNLGAVSIENPKISVKEEQVDENIWIVYKKNFKKDNISLRFPQTPLKTTDTDGLNDLLVLSSSSKESDYMVNYIVVARHMEKLDVDKFLKDTKNYLPRNFISYEIESIKKLEKQEKIDDAICMDFEIVTKDRKFIDLRLVVTKNHNVYQIVGVSPEKNDLTHMFTKSFFIKFS